MLEALFSQVRARVRSAMAEESTIDLDEHADAIAEVVVAARARSNGGEAIPAAVEEPE